MATLGSSAMPRGTRKHPTRADLATLSDLDAWEWTEIRVTSVGVALVKLSTQLQSVGLTPPSYEKLNAAFNDDSKGALGEAIETLHYELVSALYGTDPRLGKAYTLGRSLAYTCLKPKDRGSLEDQLRASRLSVLQAWLADLATALPAHTARSVAVSLEMGQEAIPDPAASGHPEPTQDDDEASDATDAPGIATVEVKHSLSALRRQGALWRDLLTGEKAGEDMLSPSDYLDAGGRMMKSTGSLARSFVRQHWRLLALGIIITLAVIAGLLLSSTGAGSKVAGSIAAGAAALGVSWSAVRASLGKTLAKVEQPLWQAELDTAIAEAITVIPKPERGAIAVSSVAQELHPRGPAQATN
ncbi:MAG: hypothetical protein ACHQAV_04845 [Solirubrobacterales bacterium]